MACGCAVVASDPGIFRKVIEEGGGGSVVPLESPSELSTALRSLMADTLLAAEQGKKGCLHIEKFYSVNLEAEKISTTYPVSDQ